MYQFSPYAIPNFVVSLWAFVVGAIILFKRKETLAYLTYFGAVAWIFGCGMAYLTTDYETAKFWLKLVFSGITLIAPFFYHFVTIFLGLIKEKKLVLILNYLISIIFISLIVFTDLLIYPERHWWGFYPKAGNLIIHPVFLLWFGITYFRGFYNLFTAAKQENISPVRKLQIKYLLWSYLFAILGAIDFLPDYGIEFYPFGYLFVGIGFTIIAYAILRHHLLDINIALTRAGIFAFVYLFVLGIPLWIGYTTKAWFPSTGLAILFATLGPFIYQRLRKRAEDVILKEQKRYQRALLDLSKTMSRIRDLDKLLRAIVLTVVDTVKVSFAAIYLKDEESKFYQLKHYFPKEAKSRLQEFIPFDSELIKAFNAERRPLLSEELKYLPTSSAYIRDSGLLIPCFIEDELLGFMLLGPKLNNQLYTSDDILVFETLSYSTSLAIENCRFWQEIEERQRQARIMEMDLFSYSLAHEIENPMTIILNQTYFLKQYLLKYITDQKEYKEAESAFNYILEARERVSSMVEAIADFGKETSTQLKLLRLEEAIESYLKLYLPIFKHQGIYFSKQLPTDTPLIRGVKQEIMQVLAIFSDNAIHALLGTKEKHISLREELPNQDVISISLSDNGYGISQEKLRTIFAAFVTSKASTEGRGMGLYNARKLIQRHKGRLWAESEGEGKGATFFIELPIAKNISEEELKQEKARGKRLF